MLNKLKRSLAATVAALASHQFSHAAPPTSETAHVMTDAECALREGEYYLVTGVRPEVAARYAGPRTAMSPDMIAANMNARRGIAQRDSDGRLKSAGGYWKNTTLSGASEEMDGFVAARMRDE